MLQPYCRKQKVNEAVSDLIPSTHGDIVWDSSESAKKLKKDASGKKAFVVVKFCGNNQVSFGVWI